MSKVVPKIKKKNTFASIEKENIIVDAIVKDLQSIPNYQSVAIDTELIKYICTLIENMVKNNGKRNVKLDKKQIAIKILASVYNNLSADVLKYIDGQIEYLLNNGMIKRQSVTKKIFKGIFECIIKKFLE